MSARHEPSKESKHVVLVGAAIGIPEVDLARMLSISDRTLRRAYKTELRDGRSEATLKVARRLYDMALGNDARTALSACIFWLKCRAQWRELGDGVNVSVSQQQAAVIRVPMAMDESAWNKVAAKQQAALMAEETRVASAIPPANSTAGREREVPAVSYLDEGMMEERPRRRATNTPLWYARARGR